MLKMRFPCLQGLRVLPALACHITVVCAILHNIALSMNDANDLPEPQDDGDCQCPEQDDHAARQALTGQRVRADIVQQYFD